MDKKGVELSVNFLVILIITLVVFGFGVSFVYRIFFEANELTDNSLADLEREMESLLCESNQQVCIGTTSKTIYRKKFSVFTLKIVNFGNENNFKINVTPSQLIRKGTNQLEPLTYNQPNLRFLYPETQQRVGQNAEKSFPIGVEVNKNALSGTYILNVSVSKALPSSAFELYGNKQKIYVIVP